MITVEGLLYSILSLRRGGAPTFWEACATLIDEVVGDGDVIAVTSPGSYVARRLQGRLAEHALFLHSPAELVRTMEAAALAGGGVPVVLSDRDRDRLPTYVGHWLPAPALPKVRLRQLDTLYADSHATRLLVLDCPSSASTVLRGACRVLAEQQPVVLVDLAAVPVEQRSATWEACAREAGPSYTWHDGMLLACESPARRADSVLYYANRVACGLPFGMAFPGAPPSGVVSALRADLSALTRLAWADWREIVHDDPARKLGISVVFDNDLAGSNFHPAETDGNGAWWRWTGPAARSSFAMPLPAPGRWNLRIQVLNWGVVRYPDEMRFHVAQQSLLPAWHDESGAMFGPIVVGPADGGNLVWVQIVTPRTRRASEDDPRRIGISLMQCTLEPA